MFFDDVANWQIFAERANAWFDCTIEFYIMNLDVYDNAKWMMSGNEFAWWCHLIKEEVC